MTSVSTAAPRRSRLWRAFAIPPTFALAFALLSGGPALAQQGWQGGVESAPLAPPTGGPVENPDSPLPGGPGVPSIMEPPTGGEVPRAEEPRAPAAPPPEVPGSATVGPQGDIEVVQPPAQKIANKTAVFSGLDKITGRIITFDAAVGETVQFGALRITPRACYTRPENETQNTTGFVEVQEIALDGEIKPLFGGWMFASSPGLHGIEHPIYDAWLIDCKQSAPVIASPGPQQ
ncbi:hypothetical protein J2X65_003658 [Ancylobacter sp. 3268]|uniref:DUF2155 domain-containing protein n=1 Tax=Ancylobacter sp. 3268 TaxID=2817752 RepID=UPI00286063E5|nr:hypothetical protein [Ancylobacter sp. 3268]